MNQSQLSQGTKDVLRKLNIDNPVLLGKGGEGLIFEFGENALKIYDNTSEKYLQNISQFQKELIKNNFSFKIPQIIDIGCVGNTFYTIEKKLNGVQMDTLIPSLNSSQRKRLFRSYYEAIKQINSVTLPNHSYGQIIKTAESVTSNTWTDFLLKKLRQKVEKTKDNLCIYVKNYVQKALLLESIIKNEIHSTEKKLVHCDYYLNNVLVEDDLSISAVLDLSLHAVVGDPRLDVSGVLTWNTMDSNVLTEDYDFLYDVAEKDYGMDIRKYIDIYLLYSSFYYGDMKNSSFSITTLNIENIWKRLS